MTELITIHQVDRTVVAALRGEIDVSNVEDVRRALLELPNLAHGLVLDLTAVAYLDSTAISLLHDLAQRLEQRAQMMIVVCPPDCMPRRVIELTGLAGRIPVLDDLADAVAQLAES